MSNFFGWLVCWSVSRTVKKCKVCKKWEIQHESANKNCFNGGVDGRPRPFLCLFFVYVSISLFFAMVVIAYGRDSTIHEA